MVQIRSTIERLIRPRDTAYAHCDIPCGIYDPKAAQIAAETVEKMMTLMADLPPGDDVAYHNSMARYVAVKEQHAEILKHEVRVIWGDYFKPPHLEAFPDLHTQVWNILKLASACKVGTNVADAAELRTAVDGFAGMFWQSKQG